jgi:hypothetical protein
MSDDPSLPHPKAELFREEAVAYHTRARNHGSVLGIASLRVNAALLWTLAPLAVVLLAGTLIEVQPEVRGSVVSDAPANASMANGVFAGDLRVLLRSGESVDLEVGSEHVRARIAGVDLGTSHAIPSGGPVTRVAFTLDHELRGTEARDVRVRLPPETLAVVLLPNLRRFSRTARAR